MTYLAIRFFGNARKFYCLFEVESVGKSQYVINKIIVDNSEGELYFFKDNANKIYWAWRWDAECEESFIIDMDDFDADVDMLTVEFNNDEEALLWFKLNY